MTWGHKANDEVRRAYKGERGPRGMSLLTNLVEYTTEFF